MLSEPNENIQDALLPPWLTYQPGRFLNVSPSTYKSYWQSLATHVRAVAVAGGFLGVNGAQLLHHDESKASIEEFPHYANYYHGPQEDRDPDAYARAWLHHIHHNPHHWQHWIFSDGYAPSGSNIENGVVEMPKHYALEMVADWMGAEKAYGGSWDMTKWLLKNKPRIRVHSQTAVYLDSVLSSIGYSDEVTMLGWGI